MIRIEDAKAISGTKFRPLPPYASPTDILKQALPALAPPRRMGVVEASVEYMKINAGGRFVDFDDGIAPYALEPASMISSRLYREMAFVGSARSGKTVILQQGIGYTIMCDPAVVHVFHMTESSARKWVDEELQPMIRNSPMIRDRQGKGRSDDNFFSKKFIGGTKLTIGPPVISALQGRSIRLVLITELDRAPLSIAGEGSLFELASTRTISFRSRGMTVAESSPVHPLKSSNFKPKTPHEAPAADGILGIYNGGTRARWYWDCFDCGEAFEPRFDRLVYNNELTPELAGASAEMCCPHCGSLMQHKSKVEANSHGYWLHETEDGKLARLDSGNIRTTDRLSYWLNGAAAAFSTWEHLVSKYEKAFRVFQDGGDEEPLKVTVNVDQGMPYLPRAMSEDGVLSLQVLIDKQRTMERGIAPSWTRFITVGVDVQKGRFVVQVLAWGVSGERAIVDRFDLHEPPKDAPGAADRILEPQTYIEDWEVLRPLLTTAYPIDGKEYGLTPIAVGCDFHGEPGVSDQAEKFWNARRKDGEIAKWFMIRGHGGLKVQDRVWYRAPERASGGKKVRSIKLLNVATDKLKDSVFAALSRVEDGPGAMHVPEWMSEAHLTEFTAERRDEKGWKKRKNMPRNEAIDISVYGLAVAIHKGAEKINWDSPPRWAEASQLNDFAVMLNEGEQGAAPRSIKKAPRARLF